MYLNDLFKVKNNYPFQAREPDWWFLALLPIFLMVLSAVIIFSNSLNLNKILFFFIPQFLSFSIILSCTDLGLKTRFKEERPVIAYPLIIIFANFVVLLLVYSQEVSILTFKSVACCYLLYSLVVTFFSILLYNNNPYANPFDPSVFTKTKTEGEEKAEKEFESPKKPKTQFDGKWGEDNG